MTKLTVAFRNFANAPKNINKTFRSADLSGLRPRVQTTVEIGSAGADVDRWREFEYKRVTKFKCLAKTNKMNMTTVLHRYFESYSDSLKHSVSPVTHENKYRHIVIIIIITIIAVGTTTHTVLASIKVSSPDPTSWLLPAGHLFPESSNPSHFISPPGAQSSHIPYSPSGCRYIRLPGKPPCSILAT
jgi:hypothetical protein